MEEVNYKDLKVGDEISFTHGGLFKTYLPGTVTSLPQEYDDKFREDACVSMGIKVNLEEVPEEWAYDFKIVQQPDGNGGETFFNLQDPDWVIKKEVESDLQT